MGWGALFKFAPEIAGLVKRVVVKKRKPIMKNEPVLVGALITLAVTWFSSQGFELSAEELSTAVSVIVGIVAFFTRRKVSPVK